MTLNVRKYCLDCEEEKFATQEVLDEEWVPEGCAGHTFRDFVVLDGGVN